MGFFQKIVQGIKKTKDAFSKKLFFAFSARELDDEFYENLEEALLTADVGITATVNLIEELKDEIFKRKIKKPEDAKSVLAELMIEDIDYDIPEYEYPLVILLSGVNGVGKPPQSANSRICSRIKDIRLSLPPRIRSEPPQASN